MAACGWPTHTPSLSLSLSLSVVQGAVVERRFKHFDWLHARITHKFTIMVVGALPDKQISGRFEDDFIERRRLALERYMSRLARHPVISQSDVFQHFITCTEEKVGWFACF
jgi:sorting nexin-9/18/33